MSWPPHYSVAEGLAPATPVTCPQCGRRGIAEMLYDFRTTPEFPSDWGCDACFERLLRDGHVEAGVLYTRWGAPPNVVAIVRAKFARAAPGQPRRVPAPPFGRPRRLPGRPPHDAGA